MSAASHLRSVPDPETGEVIEHEACVTCANLRGLLFNAEQDNRRLEKDLREWREKYERSQEDKEAKLLRNKLYRPAMDLLEEWRTETGHPNAKITDPRRVALAISVIKRYENEREKLSYVIQQAKVLGWVDPETGYKHDGFSKIFGTSDEIEKRATIWWRYARKHGLPLVPEGGGVS